MIWKHKNMVKPRLSTTYTTRSWHHLHEQQQQQQQEDEEEEEEEKEQYTNTNTPDTVQLPSAIL